MNPNILKMFMELADVSQQQLAQLLGVHQTTVSAWLVERHKMSKTHTDKLTRIIGEQNVFLLEVHSGSMQVMSKDLKKRLEGRV
ncbi:helix-turn-helix domain-containing protein [Bacillus thuringiensis]|uniref:helix-turn-helix domain-containing protein n=1 Tax=Bacillus thuringiensis TaxID=1428 RepID=UPI0026E3117D|nr:helix-turn-helix transcriptional regulator [Bacillus thuringiensis]MDO6631952.1 helix-turn-helix transcriptional regulator [Bacillus thuringiensis]MDO6661554.1 helix-turn-helix transcriptional regulator [Bacillus thuringiensis]MDO6702131.1 helix-turn-helix transcriptional regulator [Bacillus thuringiensis]